MSEKDYENITPAPSEETDRVKPEVRPSKVGRSKPARSSSMKGASKPGAKKENLFRRMGRGIKEIVSELKKVTWPTFGKVMAETGIVLVVVVFFLLVILGFDSLLSWLFKLLVRD